MARASSFVYSRREAERVYRGVPARIRTGDVGGLVARFVCACLPPKSLVIYSASDSASLAALLEVSVVVDVGLLLLGRHAVVGVVHHVVGQRAPHGLLTDGGAVREGFADQFALSEGAGREA